MRMSCGIGRSILLSCMTAMAAIPARAAEEPLTVVELFTSQGCSSCPPANANLIKISDRRNVLTLTFSVTYWDYLGWKDIYARPEFTERQVTYETPLAQPGPYTPQMVVNGAVTGVGADLAEVKALLAIAPPLEGPSLTFQKDSVGIGAGFPGAGGADVWLVRYDPGVEAVPVARGENRGATLRHVHVVRSLDHLGKWDGERVSFPMPRGTADLKTAILVQRSHGGQILSAISD